MKLLRKLIPFSKPDDKLFNRRVLAYYGLIFSVYWVHLILAIFFILMMGEKQADATVIIAFLGVPGTLAGIGFWKYLKACEKDDDKPSKDSDN